MFKFKILIDQQPRRADQDDLRRIVVSGITLVNKRHKLNGVEFSSYVKARKGRFYWAGGSNRYPELIAEPRGVTLYVKGFPKYPKLEEHDLVDAGYIRIVDIKEHGEK